MRTQQHAMTFFVTSVNIGKGGDLGGLAGADAHCQALATAAGAGNHTWHAYMSTQAHGDKPAINARDRIGTGPWYNFKGDMIAHDLADLHGDTIEQARLGNNITKLSALTEKGEIVPGLNDNPDKADRTWAYASTHPNSNRHEMLTGSQLDGRAYNDGMDHTCNNWTSSATGSQRTFGTTLDRMPRSGFPTATAAATDRGTHRTQRAVAARRTSRSHTAWACSTASPSIDTRDAEECGWGRARNEDPSVTRFPARWTAPSYFLLKARKGFELLAIRENDVRQSQTGRFVL